MASNGARNGRRLAGTIRIAGLVLLGLVIVGAAVALWLGWGRALTLQSIQETIQSWGA